MLWNNDKKSKIIEIQLLEPIVFVGSNVDTLPVLRGIIQINLDLNKFNIETIDLIFQGNQRLKYMGDDKKTKTNTKVLSEYHLQLLSQFNKNSNKDKFIFEMPLNSGLPETIHSTEITVEYFMTIKLRYKSILSGDLSNQIITKEIKFARLPEQQFENNLEALKFDSNWCQYRITFNNNKKTLTTGSTLPIHIEISPIIKELRLKQLTVQLIENRRVMSNYNSQYLHYLYPAHGHSFVLPSRPLNHSWESICTFQIPKTKNISHSTENYENFNISHTLMVSIIILVPNNRPVQYGQGRHETKTIVFKKEIDLLSLFNEQEELTRLPAYDSPISTEEIEKLNRHGLISYPPTYQSALHSPPSFFSIPSVN